MTEMDPATLRQNQAAEPRNSTWLSANAGSGKTRVLTDRVAHLLLDKVPPQNILCLTYTKAAATEMQNRLFRRLGEWSMKPGPELAGALRALGVGGLDDPQRLLEARRLFARAIETPGGLRIQTIHSFCASLLRKFPLEAGVSPGFSEMDDRTSALLRNDVVEMLASGDDTTAIDAIASYHSDADLARLTGAVVREKEALSKQVTDADIFSWFGLRQDFRMAGLMAETFNGTESELFRAVLPALRASDKVSDHRAAEKLGSLDMSRPGPDTLNVLASVFLTGEKTKEPFSAKIGSFPTKSCAKALGSCIADLDALMARVESAREQVVSHEAVGKTAALFRFASAFIPAYEARKERLGWLDFDDLILKTRDLLSNALVADWVLFRLDGGLDHILVDEAQDTNPVQWQVIERLAREFATGLGARGDLHRTIFVVGDKKQSIYSFQGADPREFDRMRLHFANRLRPTGQALRVLELEYSFRSSDAVLRFVDNVAAGAGGTEPFSETKHRAFHAEFPGRVDLWPAIPKTEQPERAHWYDPVDIRTEDHHDLILARKIADQIAAMIKTDTIPLKNGQRRPVTAGDVLILVRRRRGLFEEIIRACKSRGLPVAGADRLKLGAELAVKDLCALLSFLATPEDSLSLAAALRSPLFGWSEADLFDLAAPRDENYLWAALRASGAAFPDTMSMLQDLRDSADFLRPYELIERILVRHGGRRRLLARLGPEAQDGIDALLGQSLSYERVETPSLTGFLARMETDDVEIKRQMDSAGDLIRVMTVHGAKGLESPIVILPDTAKMPVTVRDEIIPLANGQRAWKTASGRRPRAMVEALSRLKTRQEEEALRLFYVAATRAEVWLIIAAAGDVGGAGDSWYQRSAASLDNLGAVPVDTPTGSGLRYQHGSWASGVLAAPEQTLGAPPILGDWANSRVGATTKVPTPLAPSELGGAKALWKPATDSDRATGVAHGSRVHALLEHLPNVARDNWGDFARHLSGAPTESDAASALAEARRVLEAPELAYLFVPDALSEVDLASALPELDGRRISGTVDRLLVRPDRVLAVDFKTNDIIPTTPSGVPEGLLRQMGAYSSALRQIFPDRPVEVALLWTRIPALMPLPHEIVRDALCAAATS